MRLPETTRQPFSNLQEQSLLKFLDKMKYSLETAQDPVGSQIDTVVPGLMKQHKNHQQNFTKVLVELDSFKTQVSLKMESLSYDEKN